MKPERVLLVSDFAYPVHAGTERLVFGVAEWFTNNYGIQADILCPNWGNLSEKETVNNVAIYRFKTHGIKNRNPLKRVFDFVNYGMKLPRYDAYHGFYTVPPLASAVLLAKLRGSRSVITLFSTEQLEKNFSNPIKKFLILKTLGQADFVTAYTWKIEKLLREKYFPGKNTATTQGWVDAEFGKKQAVVESGEKTVLFVGRMTESKGIFVLLEAFAKIQGMVGARLVLVGPPYEQERVEAKIKELGIGKRVSVLGFIPQKQLDEWYATCDVIAVPALHADAFGFSLMEAMAHGKPVITTEGIGLDEMEFGGIIVKPGNVEELSAAILKTLTNSVFYAAMQKNALGMAKIFDKKKVMEKYLEIHRSLFP